MVVYNLIKKNEYYDSVTLMVFSKKLSEIQGVIEAAVMMGTDHNKELMFRSKILDLKTKNESTSNDLIIGIKARNDDIIVHALKTLEDEFIQKKESSKLLVKKKFNSVTSALKNISDLNFAIISVPGRYAKNEVMKCLTNNLHVLLFSDNVSYEDEITMKKYAKEKNLLMMGPDCGTAIINHISLGFANEIKKGSIGLTGASGTGLQEVLSIIDSLDDGISQVLGTGGRDLTEEIGAAMMLDTLMALERDSRTNIIGIIAKTATVTSIQKILDKVKNFKKPIVACILGADSKLFEGSNIKFASNLQEAAYKLVSLSKKKIIKPESNKIFNLEKISRGKYLRGLYSGGTLAYEAILLMEGRIKELYSNLKIKNVNPLEDFERSLYNTVLDMGDDYFTNGMPHPMIDPKLRSLRIKKEIYDSETAVILLDCILGHGSHNDPAGEIIAIVEEVKKIGIKLPVIVVSICGTKNDYQDLNKSIERLENTGIIVTKTNAQAIDICLSLLEGKDD